jgi:hypothetical protein
MISTLLLAVTAVLRLYLRLNLTNNNTHVNLFLLV